MLKYFSCIVLMSALLFSLCACGERTGGDDSYGDLMEEIQSSSSPVLEADRKLAVFVQMTSTDFEAHARAYMEDHPGVDIQIETLRDDAPAEELPIAVSLMAGEGPDVAICFPTWAFLHNGHFLDLNDFIRNDPEFREEDYFMNVISSMETEGELYAMAYSFYFPSLFAMRSDLEPVAAEQFETAERVSFEDMADWYESTGAAAGLDFYSAFGALDVMKYYYSSVVDLENRSCDFKNPALAELLERAKTIPAPDVEYLAEGCLIGSSGTRSAYERFTDLVGSDYPYLFWSWDPLSDPQLLFPYEGASFTEPRLISDAAGNTLCDVCMAMSITDSCEDPELAWDFIKFCIGDKTGPYDWFNYNTKSVNLASSVGYMPSVNRVTYATQCACYADYQYEFWEESEALHGVADPTGDKEQIIADAVDFMAALPDQLDLAIYPYSGIDGIIWPDLYLYLTDKQSLDVTLENIQSKVTLYLNE